MLIFLEQSNLENLPPCCPDFTVARRDPNGSLPRAFQGRESILGDSDLRSTSTSCFFFFFGGEGSDIAWWYLCFWCFFFCFDFVWELFFDAWYTWYSTKRKSKKDWPFKLAADELHVMFPGQLQFIHTRSIIGRCFFQTSPTSKIH